MPAALTPPRDQLESIGEPESGRLGFQTGWAQLEASGADGPRVDVGGPDEPGISLCERERRWACEWWPPD
jgi:hypothetical protein